MGGSLGHNFCDLWNPSLKEGICLGVLLLVLTVHIRKSGSLFALLPLSTQTPQNVSSILVGKASANCFYGLGRLAVNCYLPDCHVD